MTKKNKDTNIYLVNAALRIMLAISVCLVGLLAYYALTGTFYPRGYMDLDNILAGDSVLKNLIVFGLFGVISLFAYKLFEKSVTRKEKAVVFVMGAASVIMLAAGIFISRTTPTI